jgi:hypothetical protein
MHWTAILVIPGLLSSNLVGALPVPSGSDIEQRDPAVHHISFHFDDCPTCVMKRNRIDDSKEEVARGVSGDDGY